MDRDCERSARVLFSEMTGRGNQMSIVSSTESRTDQRTSTCRPRTGWPTAPISRRTGNQVLVIEMGFSSWLPCRLTPFDGSSTGSPVGPAPAQCTDAAWSPDGKWMYFSANTGSGVHIWRQRFPDGTPEQVTSGVTQEEGINSLPTGVPSSPRSARARAHCGSTTRAANGRSLRKATAIGRPSLPMPRSCITWCATGGTETSSSGDLWVTDLESGQRQRLLPDFQMQHYTISSDGQRVVFTGVDEKGRTPVWLASLNGRTGRGGSPRWTAGMRTSALRARWCSRATRRGLLTFFGSTKTAVNCRRRPQRHSSSRRASRRTGTGWRPRIPAPGARWRFIRREAVLLRESATVAQCPRAPIRCRRA